MLVLVFIFSFWISASIIGSGSSTNFSIIVIWGSFGGLVVCCRWRISFGDFAAFCRWRTTFMGSINCRKNRIPFKSTFWHFLKLWIISQSIRRDLIIPNCEKLLTILTYFLCYLYTTVYLPNLCLFFSFGKIIEFLPHSGLNQLISKILSTELLKCKVYTVN